jgi:replication initiation and membrane attachment protein DnaB
MDITLRLSTLAEKYHGEARDIMNIAELTIIKQQIKIEELELALSKFYKNDRDSGNAT